VPRLSQRDYLAQAHWLARIWSEFQSLFGVIPYNTQRDIHAFYQPSRPTLDESLLIHRAEVTATDSSLPARAGKGYAKMCDVYWVLRNQLEAEFGERKMARPVKSRRVVTYPIARPDIDVRALAEVVLTIELAARRARDRIEATPPRNEPRMHFLMFSVSFAELA
jgi:hypothetical protein